jgi:hypothetical protein
MQWQPRIIKRPCFRVRHCVGNIPYLEPSHTKSIYVLMLRLLTNIIPKTDKALTQRMLLRTAKRGASLPDYLWKYFCKMFSTVILMTAITEKLKKNIQNCSGLNHL